MHYSFIAQITPQGYPKVNNHLNKLTVNSLIISLSWSNTQYAAHNVMLHCARQFMILNMLHIMLYYIDCAHQIMIHINITLYHVYIKVASLIWPIYLSYCIVCIKIQCCRIYWTILLSSIFISYCPQKSYALGWPLRYLGYHIDWINKKTLGLSCIK